MISSGELGAVSYSGYNFWEASPSQAWETSLMVNRPQVQAVNLANYFEEHQADNFYSVTLFGLDSESLLQNNEEDEEYSVSFLSRYCRRLVPNLDGQRATTVNLNFRTQEAEFIYPDW